MKIAFSTDGVALDDSVAPALGRCRNFLIVDSATGDWRIAPNPGSTASGGAGVRAAEALVALGVNRVVTGSAGPNARAVLEAAGIGIEEGRRGAIRDHLRRFPAERPAPEQDAPARTPLRTPAGWCCCERCGHRVDEDHGLPCFKLRCPRCGAALERRYGA